MKTLQHCTVIALGLSAGLCAAAEADHGQAAQRCEEAVASTIERVRGREAHEVQFIGSKRAITTDGDDIGVKGEGRYRRATAGTIPFTYSCAFNTKTGGTSGVMFRDALDGAATEAKAWQPDLTNVSPQSCETAVAALLKDQYPRVSGIAFLSDTRRLQPAPGARVGLDGQGKLQRAPGMNPNMFKYHCEFDPANGKLLAARATD